MEQTINGKEYCIAPNANLCGANLCGANLHGANLRGANLHGANLCIANLHGANLCSANLCSANLCSANLCSANLCGVNLRGANLRGANLCGANLCGADLDGADLDGADLYGVNLDGANLCGVKIPDLADAQTSIVAEGDIIGYKKLSGGVICKIKIPADSKRSNATGRKCRAEYVIVLEGEGVSQHDSSFEYKVGEIVRPTEAFDDNRWMECASGIHFFLTRIEAESH